MAKNRLLKKNKSWNRFSQECIFNCKNDAICSMCRDLISCKSGRWVSLWKPKEFWKRAEHPLTPKKVLDSSHILAYGKDPITVPEKVLEVYIKRVFGPGHLEPRVTGKLGRRYLLYKNGPISLTLRGTYEGIMITYNDKGKLKRWLTQPHSLEKLLRKLLSDGEITRNKVIGFRKEL